jgi:hypothetical protein
VPTLVCAARARERARSELPRARHERDQRATIDELEARRSRGLEIVNEPAGIVATGGRSRSPIEIRTAVPATLVVCNDFVRLDGDSPKLFAPVVFDERDGLERVGDVPPRALPCVSAPSL